MNTIQGFDNTAGRGTGRLSVGAVAAGSQERRFLASLLPAGAVTIGLYFAMTGLIRTDEIELPEIEPRPLFAVTPQHETPEPVLEDRHIAPPVEISLPPLPPVQKLQGDAVGLPAPQIGSAPATVPASGFQMGPIRVAPIEERIATPVRPPVPSYPRMMMSKGISGTCEVRFSLSAGGLPYDVVATCSHPGFEKEARRAVSRAEFLPQIQDGQAVAAHNFVYPLEFKVQR